jgi:cysteine desulfurase
VLDAARALARAGHRVTLLEPARDGRIEPATLAAALVADTALVSVMLVNNETGVVQDVAELAAVAHAHGALFHTDCAQAVGKLPVDVRALGADLASFAAHKAYGPKGIGALYVREGTRLEPVTYGGGQERGLRSGTLATHQIVGMGAAFALAAGRLEADRARIAALRARLRERLLALGDAHENGGVEHCVPHILSVSFDGVHGESLAASLEGLAVSTGSACNAAHSEPSHVLRAMGRSPELAGATLRFSLGSPTTEIEVDAAAAQVGQALRRLRALAPA